MEYKKQWTVSAVSPLRLDLTVWALRRRQKNRIDQWENGQYRRVFIIDGEIVQVCVEQIDESVLKVVAKSKSNLSGKQKELTQRLKVIFGTERNLEGFYKLARKNSDLQSLAVKFIGVKPPRFPTVFEALVNAIACQQVSLDVGIMLLNRISETYGKKFVDQHAFPEPEDFYHYTEQDLQQLGFSYQKAKAILLLAQAINEKRIVFDTLDTQSNDDVMKYLTEIHGIGRWSAEYVLLRGLGRIDTFPGDDVGAQKNVMNLLHLDHKPHYDEIKYVTKAWEPYAGFVYFHLLLDKLEKRNFL